MSGSGYSMVMNDRGVPEIRIGLREFECRAFAMRVGANQARADQHDHIRVAEKSHRTSGRRQAFGGRQQVERA